MATAHSPLLREQRNQILMNGALIALALVGGSAVTNERGLFVPLGIHNVISATAQAFAAIAAPAGLRRLLTNASPFGVPGETATPLGRLTIASGIKLPDAAEEAASWMPTDDGPDDTSGRIAGANFPTVTNSELIAANTRVGPDGAPIAGGGAPIATAASTPPADAGAAPGPDFTTPFSRPSGPILPVLLALNDVPQTGDPDPQTPPPVPNGAVPEPAAWAMLIGGFAFLGVIQRLGGARKRRTDEVAEIDALRASEPAAA